MPDRLTIDRVDLSWAIVDGTTHLSDLATVHGRRILDDGAEMPWSKVVQVKGKDYAGLFAWLNQIGSGVVGSPASETGKNGEA